MEEHTADTASYFRLLKDHHARLRLKYRRVARRPWLRVEPDPPAPKP